ncbi:denticleless protein homolog B-like [Brevipalpus obovatus]|uniref:denticleless protein homolog B-like n=1 Tax=Brevipalpus obovatus TaxID=246614 RepID=UPI003D9F79FF
MMNIVNYLARCSISGVNRGTEISPDFKIQQYRCCREYTVIEDGSNEGYTPLLSVALNKSGVLAIGSEIGEIHMTSREDLSFLGKFNLHKNAIFDLKWRPGDDNHIATAAGDCSICLFDVKRGEEILSIKNAHQSTVRAISFLDSNTIASGARDGALKIWDLRDFSTNITSDDLNPPEIIIDGREKVNIPYAHCRDPKNHKKSKMYECGCNRVTALVTNGTYIYTGGTNDGVIKIWDTRRMKKGLPFKVIDYPKRASDCSKFHGYSNFALSNGILYASCSDGSIYGYSILESKFVSQFRGHQFSNYSKISANHEYLVTGSGDESRPNASKSPNPVEEESIDSNGLSDKSYACVWSLNPKRLHYNLIQLPVCRFPDEYNIELAVIDQESSDIFTGCDSGRIRKWTFQKNALQEREGYIRSPVPYQAPPIQIKSELIPPTSSITPSQKRSRSVTPASSKRKKGSPLTPITNFFTKVPRDILTPDKNLNQYSVHDTTPEMIFLDDPSREQVAVNSKNQENLVATC